MFRDDPKERSEESIVAEFEALLLQNLQNLDVLVSSLGRLHTHMRLFGPADWPARTQVFSSRVDAIGLRNRLADVDNKAILAKPEGPTGDGVSSGKFRGGD